MFKKKTDYISLQGKCKWARPHVVDIYGKWSIVLYPTPEDIEKIRELQAKGLKNVLKKDDDGYHMTFRRDQNKLINGKLVAFLPPEVLNAEGLPLVNTNIGNGSDVTIGLEVYAFKPKIGNPGIATRLQTIRVDNLVPYEKESMPLETANSAKTVEGVPPQKEEYWN